MQKAKQLVQENIILRWSYNALYHNYVLPCKNIRQYIVSRNVTKMTLNSIDL